MSSDVTPVPVPPQEAPRKASRTRTLLMLIGGGVALAFGGCALFLATFTGEIRSGPLPPIGAITFIVGLLSFTIGVIWALVRGVRRLIAGNPNLPSARR